jgi:Zn-dependent M28 family amino/carboxypeptidase
MSYVKIFLIPVALFSAACGSNAPKPSPPPHWEANIENLKESVGFLTSIRPHRNFRNPQSLDQAASFIESRLKTYGYAPEIHPFAAKGQQYKNVVARYGASKNPKMIVGAHYDVFGNQPGADDNASAVAGLLEIARLIRAKGLETAVEIEFVAYSLEEPPFFQTDRMGSFIHAESLYKAGETVRGMISLEMIGYFTSEKNSQDYPFGVMKLFYPSVGDFIAVVGNFGSAALVNELAEHMKIAAIGVETLKAPAMVPGVDDSDHRNYWHFGYKAAMITDTAFFRNPNYHRESDTLATLNFAKMAEVVKGVAWALVNME